jgi:hypothetical protein
MRFQKGKKVRVVGPHLTHKVGVITEPAGKGWACKRWQIKNQKGEVIGEFDESELKVVP